MKKYLFFLVIGILNINVLIGQEEMFFETTWETDMTGVKKIILLKDMMWIQLDHFFEDVYFSSDINYDNGIIFSNAGQLLLFYYKIEEGTLKLFLENEDIMVKQIQSSDDLTIKTKFQGKWIRDDEYGEKEVYIFYGQYCMIHSTSGTDDMVLKFSYNEEQIITSLGIIYGFEENYTNYILLENQLTLFIEGKECIFNKG